MSNAKSVRVSADDVTYFTMPGNTADVSFESNQLDDTIFGQRFSSSETGLINWSVTSNAMYRGFAGYVSTVKRAGVPVAFTSEALAQVGTTKTYEIVDFTKSCWNYNLAVNFFDGVTPIAASNIESIDYMFGRVTFIAAFTPTGAVSATGQYFPLSAFAKANSFSLSMTADTTDTTSFEDAQANGGFNTFRQTLKNADLELSGFYRATNALFDVLTAREDFVVEINPDGNNKSIARGIYKAVNDSQTGDVGGDESETISFGLSVPEDVLPFSWKHFADSTIPKALLVLIDGWESGDPIFVEYLPDGLGEEGRKGQVIVTDISMDGSVDGMVEFSFTGQGTSTATIINP